MGIDRTTSCPGIPRNHMLSYEFKLQKVLHHQKQKAGKGNSSETGHEVMSVEYHRLKRKLAASPGSISGLTAGKTSLSEQSSEEHTRQTSLHWGCSSLCGDSAASEQTLTQLRANHLRMSTSNSADEAGLGPYQEHCCTVKLCNCYYGK